MKLLVTYLLFVLAVGCGTGVRSDPGAPGDSAPSDDNAVPEDSAPSLPGMPSVVSGVVFHGGPVIANARVVVVNWGPGVDPQVVEKIPQMYASVLDSPYLDWLGEYSGPQTIGRGSLRAAITISPSGAHSGPIISDVDIRDELLLQIGIHALPDPDDNTIYAVYVPAGIIITADSQRSLSCVTFCAFHAARRLEDSEVAMKYTVIADQSCDLCSEGRSLLNATTVVSTHELIDTITDPTGAAWHTDGAPALEIGGLCQEQHLPDPHFHSRSGLVNGYEVAEGWSNVRNRCVHAPPLVRDDFNRDGRGDVLWHNVATGENLAWWMNGASVTSRTVQSLPDTDFKIVGIGDFQGDGIADILWRNTATGANRLWLMNGATVAASLDLEPVHASWSVAAVGDFQGDGKADIVWRNTMSGDNSIWLMDGQRVAASASLPSVRDTDFKIVGVGDFQGDGNDDLFWRNTTTGANVLWFMLGLQAASMQLVEAVPDTNWIVAGVGDYQNDRKADIFWRNTATGDNSMWLMNGAGVAASGALPSVSDINWKVAHVADFDGDGMSDVIWRNGVTGSNSIWLMNGLQPGSTGALPTIADPNWQAPALP